MAFSLLVVLVVAFVGRWFVALKTIFKVKILIDKEWMLFEKKPYGFKENILLAKNFLILEIFESRIFSS